MSVYYRISSEDIAQFLADHTPGVWVQQNLVDLDGAIARWVMEYTGSFELRKLTLNFARQSIPDVVEDYAQCTFHFLNTTADEPDATWTTADYEAVETLAEEWWDALKGYYDPTTILNTESWTADGPAFKPFGAGLHPVLRNHLVNDPGTNSSSPKLPPQVAVTATERTDALFTVLDVEGVGTQVRNRWGRVYLPAPVNVTVEDGRVSSSFRTAVKDAFDGFYNSAVDQDFLPVMYSPTTGHAWTITEVAVDDLFDVIRSRRYTEVIGRSVVTIASA